MPTITNCLAINIRNLRQERGLTQTQLAQKAGISLIFLQGIEGERKWISPATVKAIAKALQVSEPELFSGPDADKPEMPTRKSQFALGQKRRRAQDDILDLLPRDIVEALVMVGKQPQWKWETFRWIHEGYQRQYESRKS